ncbi:MAG: hypothetical protein FWF81_06455 [Defluviitaleaceae bacterium]|nr:hypothetical protein [Defluviitaleaceae bacterium]
MKKILFFLFTLFLLTFLAACDYDLAGGVESREWTEKELGETIIAASAFWDDWWFLRGPFAWDEHLENLLKKSSKKLSQML